MVRVTLRPMQPEEVAELVQITTDTGFFRTEEVAVADEVLSACAGKGKDSGYQVYVAAHDGGLLGYVCFGPTPLTRGAWDIYWIAVAPSHQRHGIGNLLMQQAEGEVRAQGGRLILLETSSLELYEPTHSFYRSQGYREVSCIPDFYDVGDAQITFAKVLSPKGSPPMPP